MILPICASKYTMPESAFERQKLSISFSIFTSPGYRFILLFLQFHFLFALADLFHFIGMSLHQRL